MELLQEGDTAVVRFTGDLDLAAASEVEKFVSQVPTSDDVARVVIDLSGVGALDSTGLGLLVSVRTRCRQAGLTLALRDVPARLRRVLVLSGLDALFTQVHTAPEAPEYPDHVIAGVDRPAPFPLPDKATRPPAPDERLDRLAELTRRAVDAPHAFISLLETGGQVIPGRAGDLGGVDTRFLPMPLSICRHVVTGAAPLVISDTRSSALLADSAAPDHIGAYAGMPLTDHTGRVVGSLCVMDTEPRQWTSHELDTLADLADAASSELQLRAAVSRAAVAADRERFAEQLNEDVFGELLSVTMMIDSAQAVAEGRASELLDEAGGKVGDVVKRLRASIFDRA